MHQIPVTDNEREYPNEYTEVERPLLVQLAAMGWQCIRGDLDYPQKTFRERFRDVILMDKLRDAIHRINRDDDGNPYPHARVRRRSLPPPQRPANVAALDR
jgi:hypothetical protein